MPDGFAFGTEYTGGNKCGTEQLPALDRYKSDPQQGPDRTWNSSGRDRRREKCGWFLYRGSARGGTDRGEAGIAGK